MILKINETRVLIRSFGTFEKKKMRMMQYNLF